MRLLKLIPVLFALLFIGCVEESTQAPAKNPQEAADRAKKAIDLFSEKAKKFLENDEGQIDRIKGLIDTIAAKSGDIEKLGKEKGPEWEDKIEKFKNSPEFKKAMENFEGEGKNLLEQIERIVKDLDLPKNEKHTAPK
jgi:superfamily I DNA/RNA helicase